MIFSWSTKNKANNLTPLERFRKRKFLTGFTLLEVVVATLLIGVGMAALMGALNTGVFGLGEVEDYTLALSLTQERMEAVQDTAFASVATAAKADVTGFTEFEQQVTVTTLHADLKEVVVTTFWDVSSDEVSVALTSYVVNN